MSNLLHRICENCGCYFVADGGTLRMNRESFLKCPKCGSDSIEVEIKQKEYKEDLLEFKNEIISRLNTELCRYHGGVCDGNEYPDIETFDVDEVYEVIDEVYGKITNH